MAPTHKMLPLCVVEVVVSVSCGRQLSLAVVGGLLHVVVEHVLSPKVFLLQPSDFT